MSDVGFVPGQRWISEMEPDLGLGIILQVESRRVNLLFPGSNETRVYAIASAPIKRVRFRKGDRVHNYNNEMMRIESIDEENGLLTYHGQGMSFPESSLSDSISFSTPQERLLNGQMDLVAAFELRYEALLHQFNVRRSPTRGFLGGRIDLIPHQFYIAHEVTSRHLQRILLADEVGLGKTIEACLIAHRLLVSGKITRVLVLLPEPLINQWFIELYRKFNLSFRIIDEEFCQSFAEVHPESNPFLDDQLHLCGIEFLNGDEGRRRQALEAGWDLMIVDEAHRLEVGSAHYQLLKELAEVIPGLLLLTATPEKLGIESHFERLRILDASLFHDFHSFNEQTRGYQAVAAIAEKLISRKELTAADKKMLVKIFAANQERIEQHLSDIESGKRGASAALLDALLDQHGTGRIMFRNTRAVISGFPERKVHIAALEPAQNAVALSEQIAAELAAELAGEDFEPPELASDPRIEWLSGLLAAKPDEKILLICRTREKTIEIQEELQKHSGVKIALFHEKLPLVQRDRNAAWFAEEDGARLLICSEIGSEGRNFQFAHHLVLFDLPLNPELLEQRIGRLDRIGQTETIHIYVPYIQGTAHEVLARWYHEGLNAFERSVPGARLIFEKFGDRVEKLGGAASDKPASFDSDVTALVNESNSYRNEIAEVVESGRDRLLELNSYRPQPAAELVQAVMDVDNDRQLERFMLRVFEVYGVLASDLENRCYFLRPGNLRVEAFPGLDNSGVSVTFDRELAIVREDLTFLTWDHPMVTGAMELILGSESGNSNFVIWADPNTESQSLLLEVIYVLESISPPELRVDRFLPPTPLRLVINDEYEDYTERIPETTQLPLEGGLTEQLLEIVGLNKRVTRMLVEAEQLAEKAMKKQVRRSTKDAQLQLNKELQRLEDLREVNSSISEEELTRAREEIEAVRSYISEARLRLDSLRLIQRINTEA